MIGHRLSKRAIKDNIHKFWDLSQVFPTPRRPIRCPVCREQTAIIKGYFFFEHPGKKLDRIPFRCDVTFKCTYCSAVWPHGLVIDKEYFDAIGPKKTYSWREALDRLNGTWNEEDFGPEPF